MLEKTTSGPSYLQSGGTTRRTNNKEVVPPQTTQVQNGNVINKFNFDIHGSTNPGNNKSMIKFKKMDTRSQIQRQLHGLSPFDSQKEWKQIDLSNPV